MVKIMSPTAARSYHGWCCHVRLGLALAFVATLIVPTIEIAAASTVRTEQMSRAMSPLTRISFVAAAGEVNEVAVSRIPGDALHFTGGALVHDAGSLITPDPNSGCTNIDPHTVTCYPTGPGPNPFPFVVSVSTGDGADTIHAPPTNLEADAGPGSDHVTGSDGADSINGGGGAHDVLVGGDGNNVLSDGDDRPGAALDADSIDGGAGEDTVDYTSRAATVAVNLTTASGGAPGEGDTLAGFETAGGGHGDDRIIGTTAANRLEGGAGDDVLDSAGGDDRVEGGAGADQLITGAGDDLADGGAGGDRIFLGSGDDRIIRGGGPPDVVSCGSGLDAVRTGGAEYRVTSTCERLVLPTVPNCGGDQACPIDNPIDLVSASITRMRLRADAIVILPIRALPPPALRANCALATRTRCWPPRD